MPNNALKEDEKEWAIVFAIPLDTPGMTYVYGRQSCDTRKLEGGNVDVGNIHFGGQEVMTIFNDVFVPTGLSRCFVCHHAIRKGF